MSSVVHDLTLNYLKGNGIFTEDPKQIAKSYISAYDSIANELKAEKEDKCNNGDGVQFSDVY